MTDEANIPSQVNSWIAQQLIRHVPCNIVVLDRDFKIIMANDNFVEMFGDVTGKHCFEAYKKRKKTCSDCMAVKTFEDGKPRIKDESGIDKDNRQAHFVVQTAPVYNEVGEIRHIIEISYDVTDARNLQRQYNLLFERVPCFVSIIDRDLKIVRTNEFVRKTFGDQTGEHCYKLYKLRSEMCEECPALKTFKDGRSYRTKQVSFDKEGKRTSLIVSTAPLSKSGEDFDHVIEMAIDVTKSETLYEELLSQREFSAKLIESAMDALVASDASGKVNTFNPAAEKLFGVSADAVIGKMDFWSFQPRGFVDEIKQGDKPITALDTVVTDQKGREIPVRFSSTKITKKEEVIGWSTFLQDLRAYKELEKENIENERLASVGQTVAQLAHGIKNILTGLQGGMYVIKSGIKRGSSEKTNKGWHMLERNVSRITDLVKGFLSFSKGHVPEVRMSDPVKIAEEVFELYRDAAEKKGVELRFEPAGPLDAAPLDAEDIHTCLENLVSNAIDACQVSDRGGQMVSIGVSEKEKVILYEVADTGRGMEYDIKNKVFTTFFTTKGLGGTGLGLMVTRKIVQEHGGKINVESKRGEGSVFRIRLPRKRLPSLPGGNGGGGVTAIK